VKVIKLEEISGLEAIASGLYVCGRVMLPSYSPASFLRFSAVDRSDLRLCDLSISPVSD